MTQEQGRVVENRSLCARPVLPTYKETALRYSGMTAALVLAICQAKVAFAGPRGVVQRDTSSARGLVYLGLETARPSSAETPFIWTGDATSV